MDYNAIGLKAGLEIHQQIDSKEKLFSAAPNYLRSDEPDFVVKRRLHRVAGETGEVDAAVEYEAGLGKEFVYEAHNESTSLVELDEEPPKEINAEALDEALKVALLMNCEIYQHTQVMRKTVIDGSNTSGFQRTVLIGHDGWIDTSFGKVAIDSIALEEDSARVVKKEKEHAIYRLDRLGIPLVEISTAPVLNKPEMIKEAALKIGEILRACNVKRGIGTIRQDVNISISGHDRVEVKGFQDPKMMIATVDKEIERQQTDLKSGKKEGEVRNALEDGSTSFLRPMPGKARMYPETDLPLLYIHLDKINSIKKILPRMRHEIKDELKKKGVSDDLLGLVLEEMDSFNALMSIYGKDANLVAKMLVLWPRELASKYKKSDDEMRSILNENVLSRILELIAGGKLQISDIKGVMTKIVEGMPLEKAAVIERVDDSTLEQAIREIVQSKPGLRANAYMGLVISKLGANVNKKKAMDILQKIAG